MKVLLTRPAYSPLYLLFTSKARSKAVNIPLGLLYVASALELDGHQVEIVDGEADSLTPSALARWIEIRKPDMVGVGATTVDFEDANLILKEAKGRLNAITVLGGAHATVLADQVLRDNPHIDYLVRGEGEVTARALLRQLERGGSLCGVVGISYRKKGEIIHNVNRPPMLDLDKNCLPARHLIDQRKYLYASPGKGMKRGTVIQALRGCPFKCVFCFRMFGDKVRFRDTALVVDEIEDCIRNYGVEHINIVDDTFMVNASRVIKLCDEINKRKLRFSWHCFTRADTVREDLLRLMKKAGCKRISIGVESGNQGILDKAGKGTGLEQCVRAYDLLGKVGFEKRGSFILGLPYENASTLRDTIEFAKKLKLDRAFFNICTPYPGTELFEMAERGEGLSLLEAPWEEFKRWGNAVVEVEGVSADGLKEWQETATMEFYARPRIILGHIIEFLKGNRERFYYRPLIFGLKVYCNRKIKAFRGKLKLWKNRGYAGIIGQGTRTKS